MWLRGRLGLARTRRNVQRALSPLGPGEALVEPYVRGRSFVDVGALWEVHGRIAFLAEEAGATDVTAIDIQDATPEFEAERERRKSSVRFVQADLHDPATPEMVGRHEVVWCAGVIYHCPDPMHTLECLRALCGGLLILVSATIPETRGVSNSAVFFPALPEAERRAYASAYDAALGHNGCRMGLTEPFDAAQSYANWWWGLTPSSLESMLTASGFSVEKMQTNGFHTRVVARLR